MRYSFLIAYHFCFSRMGYCFPSDGAAIASVWLCGSEDLRFVQLRKPASYSQWLQVSLSQNARPDYHPSSHASKLWSHDVAMLSFRSINHSENSDKNVLMQKIPCWAGFQHMIRLLIVPEQWDKCLVLNSIRLTFRIIRNPIQISVPLRCLAIETAFLRPRDIY